MCTSTAVTHNSASDFPWRRLGDAMATDWRLLALRGLFGVIFATIALAMPGTTILALVLLFLAYVLVDGCFALATASGRCGDATAGACRSFTAYSTSSRA